MPELSAPQYLRTNYLINPVGIETRSAPRLSWENAAPEGARGVQQAAYQILAAETPDSLADDVGGFWDSGRLESSASVSVPFAAPQPVRTRQRIYWKVRTWAVDSDQASPWSEPAFFESALTEPRQDWTGEWISGHLTGGPRSTVPSPYLRKEFKLNQDRAQISRARLYITALGLYEAYINGARIGEARLTPGWMDFRDHIPYQIYDVTETLLGSAGDSYALGVVLGDGWYCGQNAAFDRQYYGEKPELLAQLEIFFADGSQQRITSDASWHVAYGPLLENDNIMGEAFDGRREMPGWDRPGFNESIDWMDGRTRLVRAEEYEKFFPHNGSLVKAHEVLTGERMEADQNRGWARKQRIYDLHQNMVGVPRVKLKGPAGSTVKLRFAEMLNEDGSLYTENLRSARCTDYYTLRGEAEGEVYEPRFTFHGFRYIEIDFSHRLPIEVLSVEGVVWHSDIPATGSFECSDEKLNQLQSNIVWGQKGNFLEVPTDCPQRDERLGWTGDAQVFIGTAAYNRDVCAFFEKWTVDMVDSQSENGSIPPVVPEVKIGDQISDGGPAWAEAFLICPWVTYQSYDNLYILRAHYGDYKRFFEYLENTSKDGLRNYDGYEGWQGFGDWLSIRGEGEDPDGTPRKIIGTAYFARAAYLLSAIAKINGEDGDAQQYAQRFAEIKAAFQREFLDGTEKGKLNVTTQTSYALALGFDLLPEDHIAGAVNNLVRLIEMNGDRLATGFVGTPLLCPVLSRNGRADVAYRLLFQENYPSWLYTVNQGATTMWERWNSWTKEQGFGNAGMNSFNHYAYGSVGEWIYQNVVGINYLRPGGRELFIRPRPHWRLEWVRGSLRSVYGMIGSAWRQEGGNFLIKITIPANTSAMIGLPVSNIDSVTESSRSIRDGVPGVEVISNDDDAEPGFSYLRTGSGHYEFAMPLEAVSFVEDATA